MPEPTSPSGSASGVASVRPAWSATTGKTMGKRGSSSARACPEGPSRAPANGSRTNYGPRRQPSGRRCSRRPSPRLWDGKHGEAPEAMWTGPGVEAIARRWTPRAEPNEVLQTVRKRLHPWSRKVQFAAARPVQGRPGYVLRWPGCEPPSEPSKERELGPNGEGGVLMVGAGESSGDADAA